MNRPRLIRGLRIAWSVWWGILCVLLVVLWVRSYWWFDSLSASVSKTQVFRVNSIEGGLGLYSLSANPKDYFDGWGFFYSERFNWREPPLNYPSYSYAFNFFSYQDKFGVAVPHWFLLFLFTSAGALPWLPWNFSIRTLLIATTVIAVVLGLVVWSIRS